MTRDGSPVEDTASEPGAASGTDAAGESDADRQPEDADSIDFEATLKELEAIVARLESEEIDLGAAISLFRRGVERLEAANRWLEDARGRVEELIAERSGEAVTRPLEIPDRGEAGAASGDPDRPESESEP